MLLTPVPLVPGLPHIRDISGRRGTTGRPDRFRGSNRRNAAIDSVGSLAMALPAAQPAIGMPSGITVIGPTASDLSRLSMPPRLS